MSAPAPQRTGRFLCLSCGNARGARDAALDENGFLICAPCWALDPPQVDVDGIFNEVAERWRAMAAAENYASEGVCDACGGRSCNGRCGHGRHCR
jgi:hypothetical protein